MRFLVFGSGAVGSYLGVKLALAGHQVGFLTRDQNPNRLREQGFSLYSEDIPQALLQPSIYTDLGHALESEDPELILLTVKAYDVADAAQMLAPFPKSFQAVVSFLNGVNNESILMAELGEDRVVPATLTSAVQRPEPGVIRVERLRGIGLAGNHPMIVPFQLALQTAGFKVQHYPDPERMKWSKLLTNIVSNASSAILGWTAKQVFDHPVAARIEINALRESVRVMRKIGIVPHNLPGVPVALLGRAIFLPSILTRKVLGQIVSKGRGKKKPSFHYDIGRGRSEITWLNGAVVRYGGKFGVPTPYNEMLTQVFLDIVHNRRPHRDFLNQPQKLLGELPA